MLSKDFVALATAILGGKTRYEDDKILIEKNGTDLQITRKPSHLKEHLRVSNPVTMVMNGEIIRHHGGHVYLIPHMIALGEKISKEDITIPQAVKQAIREKDSGAIFNGGVIYSCLDYTVIKEIIDNNG